MIFIGHREEYVEIPIASLLFGGMIMNDPSNDPSNPGGLDGVIYEADESLVLLLLDSSLRIPVLYHQNGHVDTLT